MLDEEKIKQALDKHIPKVEFDDELRQRILESAKINTASGVGYSIKHKKCKILMLKRKVVYLTVAIVMVVSTVGCSFVIYNRCYVNNAILPSLNRMKQYNIPKIEGKADVTGQITKKYQSYEAVMKELGIKLLDTPFAEKSPYTQVQVATDNETQFSIVVNNYIVGDTILSEYDKEHDEYYFTHGEQYGMPVKLEVDILYGKDNEKYSNENIADEINQYYAGMYEYKGSYTSKNGYKVNLIEDTAEYNPGIKQEKIAIFVADGIRYTITCRLTDEDLKELVDSMQ